MFLIFIVIFYTYKDYLNWPLIQPFAAHDSQCSRPPHCCASA